MDKAQIWGEAVIEHPSGTNASLFAANQSDVCTSVYSLLFILFFLLTFKHIRHSLVTIVHCCFRFSQSMKTQDNLSLEQGRIVLFIFSLFHFSMAAFFFVYVFRVDLYHIYHWFLVPLFFLIFSLIYLSRWVVLVFIGWVIKYPKELTFIAKGSRDYLILATIFTLPFSLFTLFSWSSAVTSLTIWCFFVIALCYLLFLFRTLQHFLYARFSVFFWILYLCSLEIAPLALLYSVLITI